MWHCYFQQHVSRTCQICYFELRRINSVDETGTHPDASFKEHLADIKHHTDKPVASHFNQARHSTHNLCVKGLCLLFTYNASDRQDVTSHLTDKLGSMRPGGMIEKL